LGPTQPPFQWVPEAPSLWVKWPACEADHLPPSSAEVKNVWSYTSILPIRLNGMVLSWEKHRDNFTFTLWRRNLQCVNIFLSCWEEWNLNSKISLLFRDCILDFVGLAHCDIRLCIGAGFCMHLHSPLFPIRNIGNSVEKRFMLKCVEVFLIPFFLPRILLAKERV
jgi:hypothetical protein